MNSFLPQDTTKTFSEIFENENAFIEAWKSSGLYKSSLLQENSVKTLFYLLYARYGNSAIANLDENQFQYKIWTIMFQYGPTWEKDLYIQEKLRGLPDEEIVKGSKAIYNKAYNPSSDPSVCELEEIRTINEQNTTNYKKSLVEGYAMLSSLLKNDVTQEFINKFKPLFATFIRTKPILYVEDK